MAYSLRAPLLALLVTVACGRSAITERNVDKFVGYTEAYGAPTGTSYTVRAETEHEVIRLVVTEHSQCPRMKMKVVHRTKEYLKGDEVISRDPATQVQIAEGSTGVVPCHERFARDVWVGLRVGDQVYRLGKPSVKGEVVANVSGELRQSLYGTTAPSVATVTVEDPRENKATDAGTVSLAGYASHEDRLTVLLDELRVIVSKEPSSISRAEMTRAYELYSQLGQLDTGGDARVHAVRGAFLELAYDRRLDQHTERFHKNLKALADAKALIVAGASVVPPYVVSSINAGVPAVDAAFWARGEAAVAVRLTPALCGPTPFTFASPALAATPAATRLAFSYLHFAYDDPFQAEIRGLCGRAGVL